jgi:RTX calcium-binding nonapeptide repeat (4 copies)
MANINGTNGNDNLVGTSSNDDFKGYNGADTITGNGGNDIVNDTYTGLDLVFGNAGNDNIALNYVGALASTIYGGADQDSLVGTPSNDVIYGDLGLDTLYGLDGNDTMYGSNLSAPTTDGADYLNGQEGNDVISAGYGNDRIYGESGLDVLFGNDGDDTLYGRTANDRIEGGAGNDKLWAHLDGTWVQPTGNILGVDTLTGGAGADDFIVSADPYNPGSSFGDVKDFTGTGSGTGSDRFYFQNDNLYQVFGSGISYTLSNIPNGADLQLRVMVNQNGFTDDYAVLRGRALTPPPVNPLSRSADSPDKTQVPADAELFDGSKSYRGEWVKFEDGLIGQAYTIEPDFTPEQIEAILPGWMSVMENAPKSVEELPGPIALEPTLEPPVEHMSLSGDSSDTSQIPVDAELFDGSKSYRGEWVKFEDGLIGQAYTIEANFTPEQIEAIIPGWMEAIENAPKSVEELPGPIALEPTLEPPVERTARSQFFESFV